LGLTNHYPFIVESGIFDCFQLFYGGHCLTKLDCNCKNNVSLLVLKAPVSRNIGCSVCNELTGRAEGIKVIYENILSKPRFGGDYL
jgi:hypothetical protein